MHQPVRSELQRNGYALSVQDWPVATVGALRGSVLLVHGLGEHVGRYDVLARQLVQAVGVFKL